MSIEVLTIGILREQPSGKGKAVILKLFEMTGESESIDLARTSEVAVAGHSLLIQGLRSVDLLNSWSII